MQINKFKKVGKNKYKVIFDNTEITLYEDIILKYDLLIKKDINIDELDSIINENNDYSAYDLALSYIESRMRNKKEIYEYLKRKEFNDSVINNTIDKLDNLSLLNEEAYIKAFINDKINLSSDGPYKIKKQLLELDFDENQIDNYLNSIDDDIWKSKLEKLINKRKSIMKNKSQFMFINKIKNDLYNLGYDKYLIDEYISNIEYSSNALDKDYNSALKKYNDRTKIINYLLRKGYKYEEIISKFDDN